MRLTADGHDIHPTIAVQITSGKIFNRDAARIDDSAIPLRAGCIFGVVDSQPATMLVIHVVADADDQLLCFVIIQVSTEDCVSPL